MLHSLYSKDIPLLKKLVVKNAHVKQTNTSISFRED